MSVTGHGQRFPVRGKSLTGRDMVIHGGRVLSTYTHVCDQWPTYGTKQIVATHREGHYTLDELPGNETDLPIRIRLTSPWAMVYWDNERIHQIREIQAFPYPAGDADARRRALRTQCLGSLILQRCGCHLHLPNVIPLPASI